MEAVAPGGHHQHSSLPHVPTFHDLPFTARVLALFQPHSHTGLSREGMFHRNMGGCTLNTTFETAVGIRGLVLTRGQS